MANRGVLYMVWGDFDRDVLERSLASLKEFHPGWPVHVEEMPQGASLLDKAGMLDITPFKETLFLDMDTVVLDSLDFGFKQARRFGLACSICECPWARRYGGIEGEMVEYNTGVLFFTPKAKPVFDAWKKCAASVDSSILFERGGQVFKMPLNDQAGFAKAVDDTGFSPFVLPYNWNFRPQWHKTWFGPIKVWHDYEPVPDGLKEHNRRQAEPDALIQFSSLTTGS